MAEILNRQITEFERDPKTGALRRNTAYKVNTAPDNVNIAPDGSILTGGHSKIFEFTKHAEDALHVAPSHVVRVDPASGRREDVFISVNGEINASSVGAQYKDTLLVGGVFDGHVMVCPLAKG